MCESAECKWLNIAHRMQRQVLHAVQGWSFGRLIGIDEMVAYEYAKVRYLYANKLKLPDRTDIEFFPGGHQINGKGTFDFLQKHLQYPK